MEIINIFGYLGLLLLSNISWYLYCKNKDAKHKKAYSLIEDKVSELHNKSKTLMSESKTPIVLLDRSLFRDGVTDEEIANKVTIVNK